MVPNSPSANASTAPPAARPKRGRAAGHGFQEGDAKAFAAGGHDEEIGHPIGVDEDVLTKHADEAHALRHAPLGGKVLQPGTIITLTRHDIDNVMACGQKLRQGRNHPVVALVAFARIHASDGQQHAFVLQAPKPDAALNRRPA